ncbi:MAG: FecR family protein [Dehalococcoidia bacterium]
MSHDAAHERKLSLEEIIDSCLDDLVMERATVEECLDRYPTHREALEPVLRTAIAFGGMQVEQVVQADPERRAAFMSMLQETPQERPRFRLPSFSFPGGGSVSLWRGALVGVPAAALALLAVIFATTTSPSTASAATLTVFAGTVEQQDGTAWVPIEDGASVVEGTQLRTGSSSRALVTFPDGSTATFDSSTEVVLHRIVVGHTRDIEIVQSSGRIWNDVIPIDGGDSYVVRTPHAVVSAHGTVFETFVDNVTAVRADTGLVRISARGESVEVRPGQRATATAEQVGAPVQAMVTGHISVDAPALAYLSSADGSATGASASGVVFRQVPGVATGEADTNGQSQQFTLGDVEPGRYSLVLERISDGEGDVVIETPAGRLVLPVPASSALSRVDVEVEERDGVLSLRAVDPEMRTVERKDAPGLRIAEAARARTGIDIAALAASHRAARTTPQPSPTESPTSETGALVTPATPVAPGAGRPTVTPADRPGDRPEATPTPTRTPSTPLPAAGEQEEGTEQRAWLEALHEALRSDDEVALSALLNDTLTGDPDVDRERLTAILAAIEDPDVRDRVGRLMATEAHRELAERLREALDDVRPGAGDLIGEHMPALPAPALPIRPPGLRSPDNDSDDRNRRPGRGNFPFSDPRPTPESTRAPSR